MRRARRRQALVAEGGGPKGQALRRLRPAQTIGTMRTGCRAAGVPAPLGQTHSPGGPRYDAGEPPNTLRNEIQCRHPDAANLAELGEGDLTSRRKRDVTFASRVQSARGSADLEHVANLSLAARGGLTARLWAFDLLRADVREHGAEMLVLDNACLGNLPQLVEGGVRQVEPR